MDDAQELDKEYVQDEATGKSGQLVKFCPIQADLKSKLRSQFTAGGKSHSEDWRAIEYLQEAIKGREFELKLMRLKLQRKGAKYVSMSKPSDSDQQY